jgi:hypothetical protein
MGTSASSASSDNNNSVPTSWKNKKCWKDNQNGPRTIPSQVQTNLTLDSCIAEAERIGWNTAAVQYGGQCFIGNNNDYKIIGESEECSPLGGPWINNVYVNSQTDNNWEDQGCWSLPEQTQNNSNNLGPEAFLKCKQRANSDPKINVFGLSNGGECTTAYGFDYTKSGKSLGMCNDLGDNKTIRIYTKNNWKDQGCWMDTPTRAISTAVSTDLSFRDCRQKAEDANVNTFALQDGGQCFIGNNSNYKQYGQSPKCEQLGGPWINRVYTNNNMSNQKLLQEEQLKKQKLLQEEQLQLHKQKLLQEEQLQNQKLLQEEQLRNQKLLQEEQLRNQKLLQEEQLQLHKQKLLQEEQEQLQLHKQKLLQEEQEQLQLHKQKLLQEEQLHKQKLLREDQLHKKTDDLQTVKKSFFDEYENIIFGIFCCICLIIIIFIMYYLIFSKNEEVNFDDNAQLESD